MRESARDIALAKGKTPNLRLTACLTLIDVAEEAKDVLGGDIWLILSRKNTVSIKMPTAGDLFNHPNICEYRLPFYHLDLNLSSFNLDI
jgi:hypothetical protein